jgi:hypothetical protein
MPTGRNAKHRDAESTQPRQVQDAMPRQTHKIPRNVKSYALRLGEIIAIASFSFSVSRVIE